jgi:hypothetical protein
MATQLIPREIKTFQIYKRYVFFFIKLKNGECGHLTLQEGRVGIH